jgi:hypothetical protein
VLGLDHRDEINRTSSAGVIARFAGLDFKLDGPAALCARFVLAARDPHPREDRPRTRVGHGDDTAPKFAVDCHVQTLGTRRSDEGPPSGRAGIAWSWGPDGGQVSTRFGHARVELAAGRFSAHIAVRDEALAAHFLLSGLSASVELGSGVAAFVGPSGAGKSTACRHIEGCPLFSADALAFIPAPSENPPLPMWLSHPLPGGTRPVPDMTSAVRRWLPLRAVVRVQRSVDGETHVRDAAPAAAVALLRESAFQMGLGRSAEHELLAGLEGLSRAVRMGRLQLSLGTSLNPILSRWLVDQVRES